MVVSVNELNRHRLLSIQEVAEYLHISQQTLYRMLNRGVIKSIKVGKQRRIDIEDLDAYIKRQTMSAE